MDYHKKQCKAFSYIYDCIHKYPHTLATPVCMGTNTLPGHTFLTVSTFFSPYYYTCTCFLYLCVKVGYV